MLHEHGQVHENDVGVVATGSGVVGLEQHLGSELGDSLIDNITFLCGLVDFACDGKLEFWDSAVRLTRGVVVVGGVE